MDKNIVCIKLNGVLEIRIEEASFIEMALKKNTAKKEYNGMFSGIVVFFVSKGVLEKQFDE
jgi:hypothetical protein